MPAGVGAVEVDDQGDGGPLARLQDTHAVGAILGQDDVRPGSTKRCFVCAIVLPELAAALQDPSEPLQCRARPFVAAKRLAVERGHAEVATHDSDDAGKPFGMRADERWDVGERAWTMQTRMSSFQDQ